MKTRRAPGWQLDIFLLTMIALLIGLMRLPVFGRWVNVIEIVWSVVTLAGMTVWVYVHWEALAAEEAAQRKQRMWEHSGAAQQDFARTLRVTPVQQRFLEASHRHKHCVQQIRVEQHNRE